MSDPFWDELDAALPRTRRGEAGWAHARRAVFARLSGAPAPRRLAGALAAGLAAAAFLFALKARVPAPPPASASMPAEDLDFLESAPLLEHLDELEDARELDPA